MTPKREKEIRERPESNTSIFYERAIMELFIEIDSLREKLKVAEEALSCPLSCSQEVALSKIRGNK